MTRIDRQRAFRARQRFLEFSCLIENETLIAERLGVQRIKDHNCFERIEAFVISLLLRAAIGKNDKSVDIFSIDSQGDFCSRGGVLRPVLLAKHHRQICQRGNVLRNQSKCFTK